MNNLVFKHRTSKKKTRHTTNILNKLMKLVPESLKSHHRLT